MSRMVTLSPGTKEFQRDLEGPIHRSIVGCLRTILPAGSIVHHSPNELGTGNVKGRKPCEVVNSEKGVVSGWPDLQITVPEWSEIYFEVKSVKGKLQRNQAEVRDMLQDAGRWWFEVRSIDDVREILHIMGIAKNPEDRRPFVNGSQIYWEVRRFWADIDQPVPSSSMLPIFAKWHGKPTESIKARRVR